MAVAKTTLRFEELKNNLSQETLDSFKDKFANELINDEQQNIMDKLTDSDWQRINDLPTDEGQEILIKTCKQYSVNSFDERDFQTKV